MMRLEAISSCEMVDEDALLFRGRRRERERERGSSRIYVVEIAASRMLSFKIQWVLVYGKS